MAALNFGAANNFNISLIQTGERIEVAPWTDAAIGTFYQNQTYFNESGKCSIAYYIDESAQGPPLGPYAPQDDATFTNSIGAWSGPFQGDGGWYLQFETFKPPKPYKLPLVQASSLTKQDLLDCKAILQKESKKQDTQSSILERLSTALTDVDEELTKHE